MTCAAPVPPFFAPVDMHMHESHQSVAIRFPSAQADAPAATFSVRLLTAPGQDDQGTAVLSVEGEIDLLTAPAFRDALQPLLERESGSVVVDLTDVAFMDSSGVHALVDARRRLRSQNRRLAVACRDDGQVHRLFALVGLLHALSVHSSCASATIGDGGRVARNQLDVDLAVMR